jgi:hypothetical protein
MKYHLLSATLLLLAACASEPTEGLEGRWKFISGTEAKNPELPTVQTMTKMSEQGYLWFYDGKRSGFLKPNGDTIRTFPYEVRNDTIVTHTPELNTVHRFRFTANDTLWIHDGDSIVLKFSRVK